MANTFLRQPRITTAIMGNFPFRQDCPLEKCTESKGSQIKQTEWDIYVNWHGEASKRLQKIQHIFNGWFIAESNKKSKVQVVPKTQDCKTDMTSTAFYVPLPKYSQSFCIAFLIWRDHKNVYKIPYSERPYNCSSSKDRDLKYLSLFPPHSLPPRHPPKFPSSRHWPWFPLLHFLSNKLTG